MSFQFQLSSSASVTIARIPGEWTTLDGVGGKSDPIMVRVAAGQPKQAVQGEVEHNEIKVSRFYDPIGDLVLRRNLEAKNYAPYANCTITETATDSAGVPIGEPVAFGGCCLTGWELDGTDLNKAELRKLTLTFSRS